MKKVILGCVLLATSVAVSANSFVLTNAENTTKGGSQNFALDFVSSGDGTTIVVKVGIPDADSATVDLSACGKGLPSGFVGRCAVAKDNLIMIVYNDTNQVMPKGQVSLGMFSVTYPDKQARKLSITSTEVAAPDATELQSSAAQ